MSKYTQQSEIEARFAKKNIPTWVLEELDEELETNEMFMTSITLIDRHLNRSEDFYMQKRMRYAKLKAFNSMEIAYHMFYVILNSTQDTQSLAGIATAIGMKFHDDQLNAVKTGSELLGVLESVGLYNVTTGSRTDLENIPSFVTKNYSLSKETLTKISLTRYLPPMLCEPLDWENNDEGGHLLHSDNAILGYQNQHNEKQSLDVLNILQRIGWKFTEMVQQAEPKAKGKKSDETDREYTKRVTQHNERSHYSRYVYDLYKDVKEFFFTWAFDKRGRQYSQGYDINLQGSEFKKASIEFSLEEVVTGA